MSGRLTDAGYAELRDSHDPNQSTLCSYGVTDETSIAVVRKPNDTGIDEIADEHMPALGMPEDVLREYWKLRADYRANSAIDDPSKRAYLDMELDNKYREYIRASSEAQAAIDEVVSRLRDGESITLVCFEERHDYCHRRVLVDIITGRLDSDYTLKQ